MNIEYRRLGNFSQVAAPLSYRIFPLGDSALTIDYGNSIDSHINDEVIARFNDLTANPLPGTIELIPAYSSLSIYYDVMKTRFAEIKVQVENRLMNPAIYDNVQSRTVTIPVCYEEEFASDLKKVMVEKKISAEELISIHTSKTYRVYMLGFLPGFPYMGELDEKLYMPRKMRPENIKAGSVGIVGRQTGVYTLDSPGGWQIIGRTPLKLFDPQKSDSVLLKAGDIVKFQSISINEYSRY